MLNDKKEIVVSALIQLNTSSTCTFFGASVTIVCLFFFVIGRVLTRLDYTSNIYICVGTRSRQEGRLIIIIKFLFLFCIITSL